MDKRQLVFLPRKPFSPFSKKNFFFLLTLRWPEMPFFGGETFPPPQDGEIEAAIFVAVPFFFFKYFINVGSPNKQAEAKLKFSDVITFDYTDMTIQDGIDVKRVYFHLAKRLTKGLYCVFYSFLRTHDKGRHGYSFDRIFSSLHTFALFFSKCGAFICCLGLFVTIRRLKIKKG